MRSRELKLKNCTVTLGKPFDETRKRMCPVYEKLKNHFESRGWVKKHYHAENVHRGGECYFRYEGVERAQPGDIEILYKAEVTIRGTETTCTVNISVGSFDAKNPMRPLNHVSESGLLDDLAELLDRLRSL